MKTFAYILFALQAFSLYGTFSEGSNPFVGGIPYLLGYFLPTIIGIILLVKANKKKDEQQ